ncbi:hypothetical protein M0R19_00215 [Candidatus Pacearchaeota archaeon]|jgi:hypothetical protein|nr:hypothetical protein [Candidatus Pacearchaeota archaeon]
MENKRGQGLSVNMIILIILGLAVLVILIIGFTMGWQTILPFLGGDTVDKVVQDCSTSCLAGQQYNFCVRARDLKIDGKLMATDTCFNFATDTKYSQYGVQLCDNPQVVCETAQENTSG